MSKFYVGHGNTFHDQAIAILAGDAIYAEGFERHTQLKRALGTMGLESIRRSLGKSLSA